MKKRQTCKVCHEFHKICTSVLELQQSHKLYNFGTSIFFQSNFDKFFYFFSSLIERGERDRQIPAVEKKNIIDNDLDHKNR
jgi:hypothetical protein